MKHTRRAFIKTTTTALASLAIPMGKAEAGTPPATAAPVALESDRSGGTVSVNPKEGIAGEHGTWTVTYRVGPNGIKQHGGIRVQLPDSWHAGIRNSANRLQSSNAHGENYIVSRCSREGVRHLHE